MKTILLTTALSLFVFTAQGIAAGSIQSPGIFGEKKLVTKLDHEDLKASSAWKMGDGEPPIGPGKAAGLASDAKKVQFPNFKDSVVREVSLVSSKNGCYYRVTIAQDVDMEAVASVGGTVKPSQMTFYVLLDSTVINPKDKD